MAAEGAGAAADASAASVEVRPPPRPARLMGWIAGATAVLAVIGIAVGDVLLGVVALLSAGWVLSLAYVSLTGWARADDVGVRVHWVRTTTAVRWDEMAAIEVDRSGPHGALRGIEVVRSDGAVARWAPWYPFLWFAHRSVADSIEALAVAAEGRGIPVRTITSGSDPNENTF